jgi:diaminohydroxyphosphoribosylaminopyrimidine deaminase/5-amino-6-(5-phosphoribosylamino)uracil reductase
MADPFPQVSGGGFARLRAAGLEVITGVREDEARRLNAPYLKLLSIGRPWVHAKWAMTLDGKIATRSGDSKWVSGEESRRRVHALRGRMDAVMVGRRTVVMDDPLLTARPPGPRVAARVVISASGALPEHCQLRETARQAPVILYTAAGGERKLDGWRAAGAEVVVKTGVPAILDDLGRRRFTNVLVEGGAGLFGSFLDAGAVDEFHVFVAPRIAGGGGLSPVAGSGVERIAETLRLAELSSEPCDEDVYLHGYASTTGR